MRRLCRRGFKRFGLFIAWNFVGAARISQAQGLPCPLGGSSAGDDQRDRGKGFAVLVLAFALPEVDVAAPREADDVAQVDVVIVVAEAIERDGGVGEMESRRGGGL